MSLVPMPFKPEPPSRRYLWHMFRWNQLYKLQTFLGGGLWLSRLDKFKDVLEGTLPQRNLGLLDMLLIPEQAEYTKKEYQLAAQRGYASCWHMSDEEPSPRMWSEKFGGNFKGLALRTTPDALREELSEITGAHGPCYLGMVEYIDHSKALVPEGNTLEVAFRVRSEFSWQHEARVYVHCYGEPAAQMLATQKSMWNTRLVRRVPPRQSFSGEQEFVGFVPPKAAYEDRGHNWKAMAPRISAEQLIHEILVGPRVNDEDYSGLLRLLGDNPLQNKVRRMQD